MILVTGATGHVGGALARHLHQRGEKVRVLVRDPQKAAALPDDIERMVGDLGDPGTLTEAFEGVDKAFLMAVGPNTEHVVNAAAAAADAEVSHVAVLSSIGAASPELLIGKWHADREQAVLDAGLPYTFLRPGGFASNALQWAPSIRTEGTVYDPYGPVPQAVIDPVDVAAVAAVSLTEDGHTGRTYVLTGDELTTGAERTEILSRVLGRPLEHVEQTPEQGEQAALDAGAPPALAGALRTMYQQMRTAPAAVVTDDVHRVTGRAPARFEEWCRRNAAAFR
jgi:uncharacterized protein YbjT (DUF2867 family)